MEHEAYETAMPQAHTIIFSIPMAKQCYCSNNIFWWEEKKEKYGGGGGGGVCTVKLFPILLEDLLHQGRACAVTCKKIGERMKPGVY